MYVGADYYPEHWDKARWSVDAKLMQKAGFNVVRLAEFAWVFMEPEEGRFEFAWLDEALEVLRAHGISAILCTPTAVMPAWVARQYPETLATGADGVRGAWGVRKNNCFSSGTYRLLSERITRAMAKHFAHTPNVIGWQTDNEFGEPVCFCGSCRHGFQNWLRARYGSLDELNRAWGTHFWGHQVQRWDEIHIPVNTASHNPSACLDWQRHISSLNVRFQSDQVRILREVCPRHFVTHNFMGMYPELDYYDLAKDLDVVSWDNYPVWTKPEVPYRAASAADLMRGLKGKNFWIMETNSGPGGWGGYGRNPRPGEMRRIAWQQVAHGCDGYVWFRWRTCTAGREQYWHGLLGHDGRALRRYREAAATGKELQAADRHLAGTTVKAKVAIVYDYASIWALRIQPGFTGNTYHAAMQRLYDALMRAGVNVDMIPSCADFTKYKLVLAPDLYILPDEVAGRLTDFVHGGGVLFADCRTGVKDESGLCHERTLPGLLSDALGIEIEEYEALGSPNAADGQTYRVEGADELAGAFTGGSAADWVTCRGATPLATYAERHMKAFAALTDNAYGKGRGFYLGTVMQEPAFYDQLIGTLLKAARVRPVVTPPNGVEVSVRQGKGKKLMFLINHTDAVHKVTVPEGKTELLSGKRTTGTWSLAGNGVALIKL